MTQDLLAGRGSATMPVPDTTLAALFAQQAARVPNATAVIFDDTTLTYRELDERVEAMARGLCDGGVRPGDLVAVTLPRGFDLVVALLAVHRAGAAYLPLDLDHPRERLDFMLADARPTLVLTPDSIGRYRTGQSHLPTVTPRHPAYVIYTSGSTGRPKGVLVRHASVAAYLTWRQAAFPLDADDRVLQKAPTTFDVSVWELFFPLVTGAATVLAQPGGHRDPAYLADLIRTARVTVAHFVPPMLAMFLDVPEVGTASPLRRLMSGGDALSLALARRCAQILPAELSNCYGPTEYGVTAIYWNYPRGAEPQSIPIGRPVWNTTAYVLDRRLAPVAPGVAGELYLAGIQLADGYLRRAGLTAQRFVADPFGLPGERMYRTGDLARWTDDGVLEFLGRVDDQIKVRGQRMELGEVTDIVTGCPGVRSAVVVAPTDATGGRRIVAYVTGDADPASVLRHCAAFLPDYMVPAVVVPMAAFPLLPNGKVDREALPNPSAKPRARDPHRRA